MKRKYECLICDGEFEFEGGPEVCPLCGGEEGTEGEGPNGGRSNSFSEPLYQCPYCGIWMDYCDDRHCDSQQCPQCEFYVDAEWESIEEYLATVERRLAIYRERIGAKP